MRLVVKFSGKKRYSDQECQAIYQELVEAGLDDQARRDLDAIEAVFKKLNNVPLTAPTVCRNRFGTTNRPASAAGNSRTSRRDVKQPRDPGG